MSASSAQVLDVQPEVSLSQVMAERMLVVSTRQGRGSAEPAALVLALAPGDEGTHWAGPSPGGCGHRPTHGGHLLVNMG